MNKLKLKPWQVKWLLSLFPANLFNRIIVKRVSKDFLRTEVKVRKSLLNKNLQRTIFGGTIFAAGDPFHAIMYWQVFAHKGKVVQAWSKKGEIAYLKPAATHLKYIFVLDPADIAEAEDALASAGKFEKWHEVEAMDKHGEVCARIRMLVHLRVSGE